MLIHDCKWEIEELARQLEAALTPSQEQDVLAAIRMVAVALDVVPPSKQQLKIYLKILLEMPKEVLVATAERIIREYKYPGFPRPSEWSMRGDPAMELISKAKVMMRIYPHRRKMAERKYGRR